MRVRRHSAAVWVAVGLCAAAAVCLGQTERAADTEAEITLQRALDAPIDLTLDKAELSEAFKRIADTAHVKLQVDQACYDSLPYGATTKVTATFRATPLRAAIEEILLPLGLEQAVSRATIVIRPSAALERIGRRADWDELKVLQTLRTQQLTKLEGSWTDALRTLVGKPQVVVDIARTDETVQDKALQRVRAMLPCPASQALDAYAAATGMIWTVRTMPAEGQKIIVETPRSWLARQLQEPVILDFTNAPLADVVAELSHASRIRFQPEPGLYLAVPAVSLTSSNATVQRVLDTLSGRTGIAYDVKDDGSVYLHLGDKAPAAANERADAIVGRIAVPMGKDNTIFDLYIRESDLPPDLAAARKEKLREALEAFQRSVTPATQPAPAAATTPEPTTPPATTPALTTPAATLPAATLPPVRTTQPK